MEGAVTSKTNDTGGGMRPALAFRFFAGVLAALVAAVAIFYLLLRPSAADLQAITLYLTATGGLSVLAGYAAYRFGWLRYAPRILWALVGGYALAGALTFLNVWVTAKLMFTSQHDLLLATVLLVFAGGIAMSLGYFLSAALRDDVAALNHAARSIAGGALGTRVRDDGQSEIAQLGRAFNEMAARLELTAEQQRQLDVLRRDLIAWVGHDLRTPLASIRAIVEALADGIVAEPAAVERYLRTAQRDVRTLSLLIDDLFEMAQLDAGGLPLNRGAISLADLVSDTIEQFSALASRQGVRLEGSAGPGVDPINVDAQKIGRALSNLIDNALRYTGPGGVVQVRATRGTEGLRVEVTDTGQGIAPDDLDHVFERFYRGEKSRNRATGGAGLGLAITRSIVEAHGGRVGVENLPESGARFYFVLPREV